MRRVTAGLDRFQRTLWEDDPRQGDRRRGPGRAGRGVVLLTAESPSIPFYIKWNGREAGGTP